MKGSEEAVVTTGRTYRMPDGRMVVLKSGTKVVARRKGDCCEVEVRRHGGVLRLTMDEQDLDFEVG